MDGIADEFDPDADGDGTADTVDQFLFNPSEWMDTDGDGIGDNADVDDDNDGFLDIVDANPKYAGFELDPSLRGSQVSSDDDSGTTFVGGVALVLLFTTSIAMVLIFGAKKFFNPEKKEIASEPMPSAPEIEEKIT